MTDESKNVESLAPKAEEDWHDAKARVDTAGMPPVVDRAAFRLSWTRSGFGRRRTPTRVTLSRPPAVGYR
jgi:hypothetical protein